MKMYNELLYLYKCPAFDAGISNVLGYPPQ